MVRHLGTAVLLGCLVALSCRSVSAQEEQESVLARAYFRWSAEGWNATTKDGEKWPSDGELGQLKSSDEDDTIWYFKASHEFL
ncbi:hypothetical protein T484DRAFT_1786752, partial [Baffinella frigidus]